MKLLIRTAKEEATIGRFQDIRVVPRQKDKIIIDGNIFHVSSVLYDYEEKIVCAYVK